MGAGKTAPALVNRWYCNATEMKMQLKNAKTPRIFLEIQKMTAVSMENGNLRQRFSSLKNCGQKKLEKYWIFL